MIVDEWKGCYPSSWRGLITPESFSHPAKGSSRLAERIYKHAIDEGWLHEHSTVIDPFGGIGGFAFHAVINGMIWTGVELEPKFVKLCQDNIELWDKKFRGKMPHMGTARIIQGDSRHLAQVIGGAVVPQEFWDQVDKTDTCWNWTGIDNGKNYGQYRINGKKLLTHRISWEYHFGPIPDGLLVCHKCDNPRCVNPEHLFLGTHTDNWNDCLAKGRSWMQTNPEKSPRGENHGRCKLSDKEVEEIREKYATGVYSFRGLGREYKVSKTHIRDIIHCKFRIPYLPPGDVDACISSPPYAESATGANSKSIDREKQYTTYCASGGGQSFEAFCHTQDLHSGNYGSSPGQLAALPPGAPPFAGCVSSPPYDKAIEQRDGPSGLMGGTFRLGKSDMQANAEGYGHTEGQLGGSETFWSAAREIVAQVYQVLAPGAHAIWVTKRYIKDKKIVEFTEQWIALCESVGFRTLHIHRAMLVKHNGTSLTLEGEKIENKTEYISFFRRLAQKNGSPRIDWEDVTCMQK